MDQSTRQQAIDLYDRYTRAEAPGVERTFSFERAMRNKEYRAMAGVAAGFVDDAYRAQGDDERARAAYQ